MIQPAGALVIGIQRAKSGYVMRHEGPYRQLRLVSGGGEWDANLTPVRPAACEERLRATRERARAMNLLNSQEMYG